MGALIRKSVAALDGYTPGEQPRGLGIVKLNTNENPYPPSPRVLELLRNMDPAQLRLYPPPEAVELRKRIAEIHGCSIEQVFVGNGSDEVLALCTRAFVESDGAIGFFVPSYSLYPVLARIRDVGAVPVELAADFGWAPPPEDCPLFFLANPNAPTGILYDKGTVAKFCKRSAGVVLIDEAYADFARDTCAGLAFENDNVLVARTLSKSFSLAGIRIGYCMGPAPLIEALFKLKDSYNTDMLSQRMALAALSDLGHMRANVEKIKATRGRLVRELAAREFTVFPSETNFVWAKPARMPAQNLFERLRAKKVLIRYFPGARTSDYVRITVGTDGEIDALLTAADQVLGS